MQGVARRGASGAYILETGFGGTLTHFTSGVARDQWGHAPWGAGLMGAQQHTFCSPL